MTEKQLECLERMERRVAQLERHFARQLWSRVLIAFMLGVVGGGLLLNNLPVEAQTTRSDVLVASEFRLVDPTGNIRGSFGFDGQEPRLYMRGAQPNVQVLLGLPQDTPTLNFQRRDSRPGVTLTDRRLRVSPISGGSFFLDFAFEPYVVITDTHGRSGIEMGFSHPGAMTSAMNGKPSIISEGKPAIALYDNSTGEKRSSGTVVIAVQEDGNPAVQLEDQEGNTRAVLGAAEMENTPRRSASSLILLDPAGNVTWSAP